MSSPYESAEIALESLITWAGENAQGDRRNEAATRLHLIDQLLTKCLGWPINQIEPEDSQEGTYADYVLGKPFRRLVLEAKREGIHFTLPAGTTSGVHLLPSLMRGAPDRSLRDAASQVAGYCSSRGIAIAAVCNGTQLIAFLGTRADGVAPLDGRALVFTSLEDMYDRFRLLWDNLSKPAVESRALYGTLRLDQATEHAPAPLASRIGNYPGYRRRNDLQVQLEILAEVFLDDLNDHEEIHEAFLEECYASSGALSQYAMLSKQILESRYSLLHESASGHEVESVRTKRGISQNLSAHVLANSLSKRPIILLGDVGVGKTMFVRRLIHVEAASLFADAVSLYVDFGERPALLNELNDFVVDAVYDQLFHEYDLDLLERKFVEAVYNKDLNRFDNGIHGRLREIDEVAYQRERIQHLSQLIENRAAHLKASLEHITSARQRQVVIFLDNVDQRPLEFQEQVFLISESLASTWPATVFISLRPDTFYKSRTEGTLTAYQPRVFTISPPRADVVIQKRLAFALKQLSTNFKLGEISPGINVESDSLQSYLQVLADNFQNNDELIKLVDNLASGNIRRALDFISGFVGSGHVNTRKILDIYAERGHYKIPMHEFLRAIIFGDYEFYEPDSSPVANLLDISRPDGREHFLLATILVFIQSSGEQVGTEGFVLVDEVYEYCQNSGFDEDQIAWAVDRAVRKGALERSPRIRESGNEYLRVTSAGVYTVRILIATFAYFDAVLVDTPIVEPAYERLITDAKTAPERLQRAEAFRAYLDAQWRLFEHAAHEIRFNWRDVSEQLRRENMHISQRLS